ncbi:MAG: hypothetical protein K6G22_13470 [Lachnospiraceae bacterium]|nr:hypothetical protein [Lachnospiraceae bacterium]
MSIKRILSLIIVLSLCVNLTGCSLRSVKDTTGQTIKDIEKKAETVKDVVTDWYSELGLQKFKDGWDYSIKFMGDKYSEVMSSEYASRIETALTELKEYLSSTSGAKELTPEYIQGLADKWVTDTYNGAKDGASEYVTKIIGDSSEAAAEYFKNACLKYYQDYDSNTSEQAEMLLEAYRLYCNGLTENEILPSLAEYMDETGYDPDMFNYLLSAAFDGQDRMIPEDMLPEAISFLQGTISVLSEADKDFDPDEAKACQDVLEGLKERLSDPENAGSEPLTYEEAQVIAELTEDKSYSPEDFGIPLSSIISPKFVVKQALGTEIDDEELDTVLAIGPDIFSIMKEAAKLGEIDDEALRENGVEGTIALSEGFVEGSVSRVATTLCSSGVLGQDLKDADPEVVAALTVIVIEAAIHGYELSQGRISPDMYGNIMAERLMGSLLSLPPGVLLKNILPAAHIVMVAGCMAGGMLACIGVGEAKTAMMDMVDGGGFEALVPVKATETMSIASDTIASLNIKDQLSSFSDTIVSTAKDGYIQVSSAVSGK